MSLSKEEIALELYRAQISREKLDGNKCNCKDIPKPQILPEEILSEEDRVKIKRKTRKKRFLTYIIKV